VSFFSKISFGFSALARHHGLKKPVEFLNFQKEVEIGGNLVKIIKIG
jgi:hypothetical protein